MQVVHERCCGLDVHRKTVVACVLLTEEGQVRRLARTFGTMTADLLALSDWLARLEVTQIAMESTGVYWRPVFNLLEDEERAIVLVNAQHMRAVPMAQDRREGQRVAGGPAAARAAQGELHPARSGPRAARADALPQGVGAGRSQEANRGTRSWRRRTSKLSVVASDVLGVSTRRMLAALLDGQDDPAALAERRAGGCAPSCRTAPRAGGPGRAAPPRAHRPHPGAHRLPGGVGGRGAGGG